MELNIDQERLVSGLSQKSGLSELFIACSLQYFNGKPPYKEHKRRSVAAVVPLPGETIALG
jgi:hypothetical protein